MFPDTAGFYANNLCKQGGKIPMPLALRVGQLFSPLTLVKEYPLIMFQVLFIYLSSSLDSTLISPLLAHAQTGADDTQPGRRHQ